MGGIQPQLFMIGAAGLAAGVALLVRGLQAYRRGAVVSSIATSATAAISAGEVRLFGTVQPISSTLVSALQSVPSVWYHSRVEEKGDNGRVLMDEQRSVEFLLKDETGTIRVIPRGARYEVKLDFDESSDLFGDDPSGLNRRLGAASTAVPEFDRDAAIADLLTVRPPAHENEGGALSMLVAGLGDNVAPQKRYIESRIEPGDQVTIVGFATTFGQLDPLGPDAIADFAADGADDPALALELAEARDAGVLAATPREAWGNAAIPGFGIGRPTEAPHLDAGAKAPTLATKAEARRAAERHEIAPETIVVASSRSRPLTIYEGSPVDAQDFDRWAFYRGLGGGAVAVVSAVVMAMAVRGSF